MSMYSNKFRHALMGASAMVSAAAVASAAYAADARQFDFDMPAQPLTLALKTFGATADQQLIFSEALVKDRTAPPLKGSYTPDQALAMLLGGTGLIADKTPGGVVTIRSASGPQGGSAADGADGTVQALIVTAQKREENIQDVPIAMSAFTQEDLTRSQVAGGPDLMTQVPNFTFTKTNFTGYSIQIRGIGTQAVSATTDAAVAVAFNNTPFIRNRFFEQEFYDLQRVEVLRGPQGTLYGRNATAGVVNIISAKPTFTYEARLSADLGNYNSSRLEGMINLPLVEDKVAVRLAGAWTKRDGYDTNQITGNQIDGRNLWSTRLSLRLEPTDNLHANLIWEHFQEDDDRIRSGKQLCKRDVPTEIGGLTVPDNQQPPPGGANGMLYQQYYSQGCSAASLYSPDSFQAPNGFRLPYYRPLAQINLPIVDKEGLVYFDPYLSTTQSRNLRVIESTVDPHYRAKTDLAELQLSYDLTDRLTLASETGYLADTLFSSEDYNRFTTRPHAFETTFLDGSPLPRNAIDSNGVFCDPQIGCADRLVAVDLSTAKSRQFSEELRLSSNYDGKFNFSLGANFLRYDTEEKYYVFINTLSMTSVFSQFSNTNMPDYMPGVSDNHECLQKGMQSPDPGGVTDVGGCIYMDPNPLDSLNDLGHNYFLSKNPYKLISYAIFGEAYYNISDNLKLTAGLRWTVDKKDAPRVPSWVAGADTVGYPVAEVIKEEWREPTGRLTIDWKPRLSYTDETLLYASFAHGYKAGGANPPASGLVFYNLGTYPDFELLAAQQNTVKPKTFKPEFVNAYEVGAKNTLLDGRVTLNAAAFYYDYKGYQISYIVDRSAVNLNFDSKIWGLELEADWRALENLRLGFKGGYERTRMANGSRAVDVMDRTAGHTDWYVTGPFPTLATNCILPTYTVVRPNGQLAVLGDATGGNPGPCEAAYVLGHDPVTNLPYQPNPPLPANNPGYWYEGYQGFDPHTAPNGGAGFYKDLSGNELPNAPHFTATLTADYTLPLPHDWLMTVHTDAYYQSEAWTRVFNTPGYDKLKAYTNVNLAAIFSNEDAGWKVMAYVKNIFDKNNITGAFLNSDDTGLTTNVFLNEPRLYGLRVTKEWTGGPWWTGANANHVGPYPLTIEIGGQVQRQDAPYETLASQTAAKFPSSLNPLGVQHRDLDWGDGREVSIVYRPEGSTWRIAGRLRYGDANNETARAHHEQPAGPPKCVISRTGPFAKFGKEFCDPNYVLVFYGTVWDKYDSRNLIIGTDWSDASARSREEHLVADFSVGRDVGLGALNAKSSVSLGLRFARLRSNSDVMINGVDTTVTEGWFYQPAIVRGYEAQISADREFRGAGPAVEAEIAKRLWGDDATGHVDVEVGLGASVLFGRQKVQFQGFEESSYWSGTYSNSGARAPTQVDRRDAGPNRSNSATVPALNLNLGASYEIQRIKLSTGYRWERYFNAIDGGYQDHKSYDRTIDGPYFKIAVGFGG